MANPPEPGTKRISRTTGELWSVDGWFVTSDESQLGEVYFRDGHRPAADIGQGTVASCSLVLVSQDRKHLLVLGRAAAGVHAPHDDIGLPVGGRDEKLVRVAELLEEGLELFGVLWPTAETGVGLAIS